VTRASLLAAFVLAACGDTTPPGFSAGPEITSVSQTTSGSEVSGDTSSTNSVDDSAGSSASTSTGTIHDVGAETDFGTGKPLGCQGKVDLLFVISREGTMQTEQEQLLASFKGFIDTIEQKLEGFDVHIMTANPDGKWPGWACEQTNCIGDKYFPHCGPEAMDYWCGTYPDMITSCDEELGAGLIFNAGSGAANKVCNLFDGHRYIVSGEPDMKGALECIAKVGWMSGDMRLGDAMIAALSTGLNDPGKCNEGFLRDDALLVVTFISDTEDESVSWYNHQEEAILAAKGDANAVVLLAIVPQPKGDAEPVPGCTYDTPRSISPSCFHDSLTRSTATPAPRVTRRSSTRPRTRSARRAPATSRSDRATGCFAPTRGSA